MQDGEIIDYSRKDGHHYVFGASSKNYEDNYDRIFRKKVKHGKSLDSKSHQTPRRVQRQGKKGGHVHVKVRRKGSKKSQSLDQIEKGSSVGENLE